VHALAGAADSTTLSTRMAIRDIVCRFMAASELPLDDPRDIPQVSVAAKLNLRAPSQPVCDRHHAYDPMTGPSPDRYRLDSGGSNKGSFHWVAVPDIVNSGGSSTMIRVGLPIICCVSQDTQTTLPGSY
jgi:hypothetical protein